MFALLLALSVVVIVNLVITFGLVRIVATLYRSSMPDTSGAVAEARKLAPPFVATSMSGRQVDSGAFVGRLTALLFISPSCSSCLASMEQLEIVRRRAAGHVVLICDGTRSECEALASRFDPVDMVFDGDRRIRSLYQISSYPSAVLIGVDGRIQSYGRPSAQDIADVVDHVTQPPQDLDPRAETISTPRVLT